MANDKKSSLYGDQGGEEAVTELDEYGVWVKSDPAEISASESEDIDFPIPNDVVLPDIEEISADELGFPLAEEIDDLDKEFIPENLENSIEDLDSISFDNIFDADLDDIEELRVEDILKADADFIVNEEAGEDQKITTEVPTIDALSLGNETGDAVEPVSEQPVGNGIVSGENVGVSEEAAGDTEKALERGATELFMEDFLDDSPFDDDEIFGKENTEASVPETEEAAPPSVATDEPDEAELVLAEIVDGTAPEAPAPEIALGAKPVLAETEEVIGNTAEGAVPEATVPEIALETESVSAETEEAVDNTADGRKPEIVQQNPSVHSVTEINLSTELLLRIAEELSSIRQELSTLKQDFFTNRTREPVAPTPAPIEDLPESIEDLPESEEKEAVFHGGFFDDSGDEKIALTGNELDNILMSADFTEEAGVDISEDVLEGMPEAAKIEPVPEVLEASHSGFFGDSDDEKLALTGNELDNVLMSASFTEEIGEDISEAALEMVEIEPVPETSEKTLEDASVEIDEVILDPSKDSEELQWLREEGVEPITPALEDSSYLEADPIAQQESEVEDIDLSDVVIEEPDLSGQLQENPLQEPVLEAITFDDMPLDLSDEDIFAGADTAVQEKSEEEPLLEIPVETPAEILPEVVSVVEDIPVEPTDAETAVQEKPEDESLLEIPAEAPIETFPEAKPTPITEEPPAVEPAKAPPFVPAEPTRLNNIPPTIQQELKTVLSYMDQLLESLPEEKIEEFAASKYFDIYKKLFSELGLV
ncbi:MAG: hypothetical protein LBB61_01755 [Treponema sp.]|jgi:hypothetical protein|nr:hypothetical protein [Treponema sp.]